MNDDTHADTLITYAEHLQLTEALVAEVDRERARADRAEAALTEARDLALAVADKNIGPLSERGRELQGLINHVLGDIPSVEDIQGILSTSSGGQEVTP